MQSTTSSTRTFITPPAEDKKKNKHASTHKAHINRKNLPWIIVTLLIILSGFLFWQYHEAKQKLQTGTPQYYAEMNKRLGKLIILPTNETPTIVTVKNASLVHGQIFYAKAQNGDVTFVYSNAHEAILYRPSQNIIVNVAPVNVNAASDSTNLSK